MKTEQVRPANLLMVVSARPGRFNSGQRTLEQLQTGVWQGHRVAQDAAKRHILLLIERKLGSPVGR
jgi:hypothetical protein